MKKSLICLLLASSIIFFKSPLKTTEHIETIDAPAVFEVPMTEKYTAPIPWLAKFDQISSNQIQISYNMDVDIDLGTLPYNYWIQSLSNAYPNGIATVGSYDNAYRRNSLNYTRVKIAPKENSSKIFILTFNQDLTIGEQYKLIIRRVTIPNAPYYNGDNGSVSFVGRQLSK